MENNVIKRIEDALPVSTKEGLQKFAIEINDQLETGSLSGMELLKTFKMIEKLQEYVKSKMIKAAVEEASKYPEAVIERFGVTFKKTEVGTSWDYSNTNDFQYKSILETEEKLKKEKKQREDFLKSIQGSLTLSGEFVDTETGDVTKELTLYPPTKISTSTLSVTIK